MRTSILLILLLASRALQADDPFHTATLRVHVETSDGAALPGATLAICSNGPLGYTGYAQSDGVGEFHVPALTYYLVVSISGFLPVTVAPVPLAPESTASLRVVLRMDPRIMAAVTAFPGARGPDMGR